MGTLNMYWTKLLIFFVAFFAYQQTIFAQVSDDLVAQRIASELNISISKSKEVTNVLRIFDDALRELLKEEELDLKERRSKMQALYKDRLETLSRHLSEAELLKLISFLTGDIKTRRPALQRNADLERLNGVKLYN